MNEAEVLLEKCYCENSLHYFLKKAWPVIESERNPFIDSWHIRAACEHLEAVLRGTIPKLMANIPPRTGKTNLFSVVFPAWAFVIDPSIRFLFASYAQKISLEHSRLCRMLIESEWYQNFWGDRVIISKDQSTKSHFTTTENGHRIATSVRAGGTALGGDFLIMDDPNDAKDGESKVTREAANDWYSRVWASRLNPGKIGALILVQQRVHYMDVSGYLEKNDSGWVKLCLPMEYEPSRKCKTVPLPSTNGKPWEDPRTKVGELLCPDYLNDKKIKEKKIQLGSYNYAGQYQQNPAPTGGGVIKREWFKVWTKEELPTIIYILQSWDTDMTGNSSKKNEDSNSACITLGLFRDEKSINNVLIMYAWQDKIEYPSLLERVLRLYANCSDIGEEPKQSKKSLQPDVVIVESAAQGHAVLSELTAKGVPAKGFYPRNYGDKENRARIASTFIENHKIWVMGEDLKTLKPDHEMLVSACEVFPKGETNDLVDALSQAIIYLREKGMLVHSLDMNFDRGIYPEHQMPEHHPDKNKHLVKK